jgi:hypothetical protein
MVGGGLYFARDNPRREREISRDSHRRCSMPLRRAVLQQEPRFDHPSIIRFPMIDGECPSEIVWGEVSDFILRARAVRDGKEGLLRRKLFEQYRLTLEGLASEAYDDERTGLASDGARIVPVDDF